MWPRGATPAGTAAAKQTSAAGARRRFGWRLPIEQPNRCNAAALQLQSYGLQ